jgi:hypothetical protein
MGILGTIVGCCKAVSCSRLRSRVRRLTDRQYLIMNNSLILFCSLYQGLAGFGVVMLFNQNLAGTMSGTTEDRQAGTQSYMVQAVLGGFLTILSIVAIRAAIKVRARERSERVSEARTKEDVAGRELKGYPPVAVQACSRASPAAA